MKWIKMKLREFRKLFWIKCPECGGRVRFVFIDMEFDKAVYECLECKKEFI